MAKTEHLTEQDTGRWLVRTRDSVHLFDFDAMTVTRIPNSGALPSAYDATRTLLRIVVCTAGENGHWHTRAEGRDAERFEFIRHATSRILRIDPAPGTADLVGAVLVEL